MPSAVSISTMHDPRVLYNQPREEVNGRSTGAETTWQVTFLIGLMRLLLLRHEDFLADFVQRLLHVVDLLGQGRARQVVHHRAAGFGAGLVLVAANPLLEHRD